MDFNNKVVVITGAGNGIGRALAIHFSRLGAKLSLNSKTKANLDETVRLINASSETVFSSAFDISNKEAVFEFAQKTEDYFGKIDMLINNAGVAIGGLSFEELEVEDFEWIFSINYMGTLYASKAFLPALKANPNQTYLINISSIFGLVPMALKAPYCSTKYAVAGFTDSLRMELDPQSIKVIGVYPGGVKTGVTLNAHKADKEPEYAQTFNKLLKMTPEKAAEQITKGIISGKETLVIGNDAKKARFAHRFLPFVLKNIAKKTMLQFKS